MIVFECIFFLLIRWLGHALRRKETKALRLVKEFYVDGKRKTEIEAVECDGKRNEEGGDK